MERSIMGEPNATRDLGLRPNFSEVARRYGMDRHTVAKYWRCGGELPDGRRARESAFEAYSGTIEEKASIPGVTKRAIYEFLVDRHPDAGLPGYSAFTEYCRRRGLAVGARGQEPHPRFETPPGRQMQFDWKEGLRMVDRNGEVFEFNVFTATLGYSRLHRFRYSATVGTDDLLACLLDVLESIGGVPEECLTDNMSAAVSVSASGRKRSERVARFAKEAGFDLQFCAVRTPETKGKDESANRFVNRLMAYDRGFEGLDGLLGAIARIEARSNSEPCQGTGVPPAALFLREKELLRPIGNLRLLKEMVGSVSVQTVPPTMLVRAAGRQRSVPRACIGKRATVTAMPGGQIRVTVGGELVAVHRASDGAPMVNYTEGHYMEAIAGKRRLADADIRAAAAENLRMLEGAGGGAL